MTFLSIYLPLLHLVNRKMNWKGKMAVQSLCLLHVLLNRITEKALQEESERKAHSAGTEKCKSSTARDR